MENSSTEYTSTATRAILGPPAPGVQHSYGLLDASGKKPAMKAIRTLMGVVSNRKYAGVARETPAGIHATRLNGPTDTVLIRVRSAARLAPLVTLAVRRRIYPSRKAGTRSDLLERVEGGYFETAVKASAKSFKLRSPVLMPARFADLPAF